MGTDLYAITGLLLGESFRLAFKANFHSGLTSIQYNASKFTASIRSVLLLKSEHHEVVVINAGFFDLSCCEVFVNRAYIDLYVVTGPQWIRLSQKIYRKVLIYY